MGGQAAPQSGAPEPAADLAADGDVDVAEEMMETEEEATRDTEGTETTTTVEVATDDLDQFSGAQAHPSESVIRPAETPAEQPRHDHVAPPEHEAPTDHVPQGPAKTDPDTQ
jgi:hypothetical protein